MTGLTAVATESQVTVATVRSHARAGRIETARRLYGELLARLGPKLDVVITEGFLLEAEGDLEAALASFQRAAIAAPASVHANAQSARVLMRMERAAEAAAAASATLALDQANIIGLTVLSYACGKAGRTKEAMDAAYRLARAPDAPASVVTRALDQLASGARWTEVLHILDASGTDLSPALACKRRVEALLELGWRREALTRAVSDCTTGAVKVPEMVDWLIGRRAFTVAAGFARRGFEDDPTAAGLLDVVAEAAERAYASASLRDSPFEFADALCALALLFPDRRTISQALVAAAAHFDQIARASIAKSDFRAAADNLTAAARLLPTDREILLFLAEVAGRAGRRDRHVDTLLRIHQAHPDERSLSRALDGAISEGLWEAAAGLLSERDRQSTDDRSGLGTATHDLSQCLQCRLEDLVRNGEFESGLSMVTALRPWAGIDAWPPSLISRLLAAIKRRLRSLRASTSVASTRISLMYLTLDPSDLDVRRILATLYLRVRRHHEAAEILAGVVGDDPHVARDWLDLAAARHELGQFVERDACVARALVIEPTISLPKPLEGPGVRLLGAGQ